MIKLTPSFTCTVFYGFALLGLSVLVGFILYWLSPKPELIKHTSYSSAYFSRSGELLRLTLANDERFRLYTPLQAITQNVQQATIIYEDKYFYQHPGVNIAALARAINDTYIKRTRRIGASTLTMQVARLRFNMNSRSIVGKIQQMLRALQIERHYSKAQILQAYLNLAPYGANIEGIGAASWIYFNKPAHALTQPEATLLAVIPQNPNKRNIATHTGFNAALKIARRVNGDKPLIIDYANIQSIKNLPFVAPHFINRLILQHRYKPAQSYTTSLNLPLQKLVRQQAQQYITRHKHSGINNTAALLLNFNTMHIEAELGSVDFFNRSIHGQVNGTRAKRSPGSTLKPFIYAGAIDQGLIHPYSLLKDAPQRFGAYTPENYDQQFMGPVLATHALALSRNVPAVSLQAQLTAPTFHQLLLNASISQLRSPEFYGLALALGGVEVTMHELAGLYAMLGNLGLHQKTRSLLTSDKKGTQLISPEAAYIALNMLKSTAKVNQNTPLQKLYQAKPYDVYWKTGTSFAFRDAWAVGIFGHYVLAVWVGNFDGEGNPNFVGRAAAGPLFFNIIQAIANEQPIRNYWPDITTVPPKAATKLRLTHQGKPLNLRLIDVCKDTGELPNQHCPTLRKSLFIPGKSPIKSGNIYRKIWLDKKTGLRACNPNPKTQTQRVFEFWPSDLLQLFNQAGIQRKLPPAFMPECTLDDTASSGLAPRITSPSNQLTYALQKNHNTLALKATADTNVAQLYWFANQQYLGSQAADQTFFWSATVGTYTLKVVDDHGRSASIEIIITLAQ
ncbi:penicillin-binding protein 1C [Marinagarivorans algicola]|uniref:penicillin-binding protein 1C n=1 Tax=Marinagarivorans algicola TaxID=1513270 RepID=UPI003735CF63